MLCPTCHSETANQPVCPYCGTAIQSVYYNVEDRYNTATQPVVGSALRSTMYKQHTTKKLPRSLETKLYLILAMQGGNFLLLLLLLVVFALK